MAVKASARVDVGPVESPELQQLRRGELSLDAYLDAQVELSIRGIRDLVSADELTIIKEVLRDELVVSPALAALVQETTGLEPTLPGERLKNDPS